MTDKAIEAGARALLEQRTIMTRDEANNIATRIIDAAIASGALVPASAVVEMRERCAAVVDGYAPATTDMLSSKIAEICDDIVSDIRQLDTAPASGEMKDGTIDRVAVAIAERAIERGHPIKPVVVRHVAIAAIEAMQGQADPASGDYVVAPAKPIGWFNPWDDYHGFQQVAEEFEGTRDTIPLYADQKAHDDLKAARFNAASRTGGAK